MQSSSLPEILLEVGDTDRETVTVIELTDTVVDSCVESGVVIGSYTKWQLSQDGEQYFSIYFLSYIHSPLAAKKEQLATLFSH